MDAQSVAAIQKKLRSAYANKDFGSDVVKHMQKVEDFSSEKTNREAYIKARTEGHMKYIYHGKINSTRLKTESPEEHIDDMLQRAKKAAGPQEIGMPGEGAEDDLGGELPMAESKKVTTTQLDKLIMQEVRRVYKKEERMKINFKTLKNLVVEEISKIQEALPVGGYSDPDRMQTTSGFQPAPAGQSKAIMTQAFPADYAPPAKKKRKKRRMSRRARLAKKHGCSNRKSRPFRMRRANWKRFKAKYRLKRGQWPHGAFPAFSVKGADGKPDDAASFKAFYDEVRKNKCAFIALGGRKRSFDYKFGDQHSDAYSELNPSTRATGKMKISDKTAKEVGTVGTTQTKDVSSTPGAKPMQVFKDKAAYNIAGYEKYSRRAEKYKRRIKELEEEMQKLQAQSNAWNAERRAGKKTDAQFRTLNRPVMARFEKLSSLKDKYSQALPRIEKLVQQKAAAAKAQEKK